MMTKKNGDENEEEKEYVFIDISEKTHDGVVLTQSEHPVVVLTGIGSADSVCLNNTSLMNKSANRKIRVVKKRITRLTRVTKKCTINQYLSFFVSDVNCIKRMRAKNT